ncbi:MAG: hypothetical protein HYZ79_05610 [Candidatus Melainabacteria bacterium]|nr:hypothetical protein [Candidatus Melainabacteria bacterium]
MQYPNLISEIKLIDEYLERTSKIKLEVSGNDLKQIGFKEGKEIGQVLEKILEKKITNPSMTKDEELKVAKEFKD